MRRVGQPAGDAGLDAVADTVEALGGALAGDELLVPLVDVAGDQGRCLRIGAGHDQARHAAHISGQPGRVQRLDVLAGRDQDLAAEVTALLLGRELVLPVHARSAGRDHGLHQLEGVENAAESGLGVRDDRCQPVRRALVLRFGPGDLVGPQQRVVDAADNGRTEFAGYRLWSG